jgi:hypothetical protein
MIETAEKTRVLSSECDFIQREETGFLSQMIEE